MLLSDGRSGQGPSGREVDAIGIAGDRIAKESLAELFEQAAAT